MQLQLPKKVSKHLQVQYANAVRNKSNTCHAAI